MSHNDSDRAFSFNVPVLKKGTRISYNGEMHTISHVVVRGVSLCVALQGVERPVPVERINHEWRQLHYQPRPSAIRKQSRR